MSAGTLNCPMCGAAASSDSTKCQHCGARLATVACPSCFGMIFAGAKFCSHCGAKVLRASQKAKEALPCPHCNTRLGPILLGDTALHECPRCEGVWADVDSLEQICANRERQAAVLGAAVPLADSPNRQFERVRYRPCPICKKLMNRVNFARCSQVVVDVCKGHGTWFDRDELRRIVEFIRSGGLEAARAREIAELEERQRELNRAEGAARERSIFADPHHAEIDIGVPAVGALLRSLLR